MTTVSKAIARRMVFRDGVEAQLAPLGYARASSTSWVRDEGEVQHVIAYPSRYGTYRMQWGVVVPEVTSIVFGREGKLGDVAWSLMTDDASAVCHPPAAYGLEFSEESDSAEVTRIAEAAAADAQAVAEWLSPIRTRRDLREFLMLNRERQDRRFTIPSSLPLKLFTSAALAVVDGDPASKELLAETERAFAPWTDEQSRAQLVRLREAARRSA
jgi:hypothetical protein